MVEADKKDVFLKRVDIDRLHMLMAERGLSEESLLHLLFPDLSYDCAYGQFNLFIRGYRWINKPKYVPSVLFRVAAILDTTVDDISTEVYKWNLL